MCQANVCGMYGKCWMCPPDIGDIEDLMHALGQYKYVFVYQTIGTLEDSFDIEGMHEAGAVHNVLTQKVRKVFASAGIEDGLHLGAGGCRVCESCAKKTGQPCRFPDKAIPSLEAYGVNVSEMASAADMRYINGVNTVTYFGAVFFSM